MQRQRSVNGGLAINHFQSLSAAGFVATAISFGPARMGFGSFVPEFQAAFDLSTSAVGFVASLGFLAALLVAQALLNRHGPEVPMVCGLGAATAGRGIVALAPNPIIPALGVFLAASSAGFEVGGVEVLAARVRHGPTGFPCLAYRLTLDGERVVL